MPVREWQGAAFRDARPRSGMLDEAVHGRGRAPIAWDGRGYASRSGDAASEGAAEFDALRGGCGACRHSAAGARVHPIKTAVPASAGTLDFRPPEARQLKAHVALAGFALAERLARQRRAGVEQSL